MIMKKWRIMMMNKEKIVEKMIIFIEDAERDLQASKFTNDSRGVKMDIVSSILEELEQEVNNEN